MLSIRLILLPVFSLPVFSLSVFMVFSQVMAQSDNVLNVATSPAGSTTAEMFKDLGKVCTSAAWLRQKQTSGSIENLELLLNNQVSMAFIQLDVLKARDQIDHDPRTKELKTLLPLNYDEIHLIAKHPTKGMFGKVNGVTAFSGLSGKRLGVWGGSLVTSRILKAKSKVNFEVVSYADRPTALKALETGGVDAILAVVGQPADWVKVLDPATYALLPIDVSGNILNGFYKPMRLLYPRFGGAVNTYGVQRLLVTRDFKSADKRKQLLGYQACAKAKLTKLQEGEGMHPKWQEVDFKSNDWPMYK